MARVECSHNIAHCIMTPVGHNAVHCILGGDVRGEATLPYDPLVIQGWIKSVCGLTCFNFGTGFEQLKRDMKPLLAQYEQRQIQEKFERLCVEAQEERKRWQPSCHAQQWAPSKWTATEETETVDIVRIRQ